MLWEIAFCRINNNVASQKPWPKPVDSSVFPFRSNQLFLCLQINFKSIETIWNISFWSWRWNTHKIQMCQILKLCVVEILVVPIVNDKETNSTVGSVQNRSYHTINWKTEKETEASLRYTRILAENRHCTGKIGTIGHVCIRFGITKLHNDWNHLFCLFLINYKYTLHVFDDNNYIGNSKLPYTNWSMFNAYQLIKFLTLIVAVYDLLY